MNDRIVTVFGGTGFLGRRVVRHLRKRGFAVRIASKHPDRCHPLFGHDDPQLRPVQADVRDERSVANALAGAYAVVNAVRFTEHGHETFHSMHVEFAERLAVWPFELEFKRFAHVSGIVPIQAHYRSISERGEGELAVRAAFADALFIRPAVMFGPDDAFLTTILKLLDQLPIYPMFGRGRMRLQPVYVEDVAEAIATALQLTGTDPTTFECGGPRVYTYEELLRAVAHEANIQLILIPIPFAAWHDWLGSPNRCQVRPSLGTKWN